MAGMSFDASELHSLTRDLGRLAADAAPLARVAVTKTARDIEADAKAIVPVDTGNLKNSIGTTLSGNAHYAEAVVGPTASYGAFVELGTSRMAPQPYMGPAFDRRAPLLEEALAQIVDRFGS